MAQHLEMTRALAGGVAIPVVADIEPATAMRSTPCTLSTTTRPPAPPRWSRKTSPKDTSLLPGGRQELVPIQMLEVAEALRSTGVEPPMAEAAARRLLEVASHGRRFEDAPPETYHEANRAL